MHPALRPRLIVSIATLSCLPLSALASCGSTSCSINTDWSEHGMQHSGWSADIRYNYSRADKLKSGSDTITVSPTDPAYAGIEVENQRTINQSITATLDYSSGQDWGMVLQLPYIMRDHTHQIGDPNPANVTNESFTANDFGDIKVMGRYRWQLDEAGFTSSGIKLGMKLPTGRHDFQKKDASGASIGVPDEVTLQPGNGSTDLIAGAFWNRNTPGSDFSWYVQGMVQSAVDSLKDYRPGNQYNLDLGMRYAFSHSLNGLLQLNAQWNNRDSGNKASLSPITGEASSGGKLYALSPGLSYAATDTLQIYAIAQIPLYQYVNGEQLTTAATYTFGLTQHY